MGSVTSTREGRDLVPLKNICSKKCESPLVFFVSYFDPVPINAKTVTVLVSLWGTVMTRKPLGRVVFSNMEPLRNHLCYLVNLYSVLLHGVAVSQGDFF